MGKLDYEKLLARVGQGPGPLLIICHISPDGDAIGAALALAHYCEGEGRAYVLVNDDPIPARYDFLPYADRFRLTSEVPERFAQAVAVDCADERRMGSVTSLFAQDCELINIDHHDTNSGFGAYSLVEGEAAATCLVLYRMMRASGTPIGRPMALCLYTGIVFDTGGFRYNNSTPEIHMAAADLLTRDIEPFMVADRVLEALTREQAELIRLGLATLTTDDRGRVAHVAVDRQMLLAAGADEGDADVLLPFTRSLSGVEVGLLFRERPDGSVKVSMRSRDRVDVGAIALHFGGGGHVRAAGCNFPGPLHDAVSLLLQRVKSEVASAFGE